MSKDFFQRNLELMNTLRSEQFKVRQYLQKGKYKMKTKLFNKGKKHYDFDLNSQEYFHEELYDLAFQSPQIQQCVTGHMLKILQESPQFKNQQKYQIKGIENRKNQSQVRHLLYRFFNNRAYDLSYEKYQIMQRLNNISSQNEMGFVKSRINLIDKQIQISIIRADRLICQDYFEETYTLGGKPVPVGQNNQSIYKFLQEEDSWFSNIHRDDIIIYTRNKLFKTDILNNYFLPFYYESKYLIKTYGIDILVEVEEQLQKKKQLIHQNAVKSSKQMISIYEKELEAISPGNLIEKQIINAFIFNIFGVQEHQLPVDLPLYPAIQLQILQNYNQILPYFFKTLQIKTRKQLNAIMPKFNNFCAILFKYQNKQMIQTKPQLKLGLQDDIDIKKELYTMLQQIWVNKYVKIDFARFQYRYRLQSIDWPLDTISIEHNRQRKHKQHINKTMPDPALNQFINLIKITNYNSFRKHMKKHSEQVLARIKEKYIHMQNINRYNVLSNQQQTLEHLGELFRIKFHDRQTNVNSLLKNNAKLLFQSIFQKQIITNPVEIQLEQMIRMIKLRQIRTKVVNVINGMRCYHRNLALDLRVISNIEFKFHLDDQMLINSNKQVFESFQKAVKDTQTIFSKSQNKEENGKKLTQEQFLQHQQYEKNKFYKRDNVSKHFYNEQIPHILVNSGLKPKNKILYDIVNQDIKQIQARILQTCTIFINRYERYIKAKKLEEIVDRLQILSKIYQLQLEYQYEKFKLIQSYYYIYQNTNQPLNAFKISKIIVDLIYKTPNIDLEQTSFINSYLQNIQSFKQQIKIVNFLTNQLENIENQKCKNFHDKFARALNIPLTFQGFLYGDLDKKKSNTNKLQRMNSVASRLSKQSKKDEKNLRIDFQIKQQQIQEDSQQEQFDLQKYDEYLLKKNMDAIFDDMVAGDQNANAKETSHNSNIALENIIVNPKFQGGPHIKVKIFPEIKITSQKSQNLVNFTSIIHFIGNIRHTVETLRKQFETQYGFCSELYQNQVNIIILKRIYNTCLSPQPLPPKWHSFQTDDPYLQTVTKSAKYYTEMMFPCLQPPSIVQMAIPSTLQKHHDKLPIYSALQFFDYHSIESLIKLKKPVNIFRYKEHSLGINFVEFIGLCDKIWQFQLNRRGIQKAYDNLAKQSQISIERSLSSYAITGQSQVFLSIQEVKLYNADIIKYPIFTDSLEQIRQYIKCQLSDLQVFKRYLEYSKNQLQNLIIMKNQIDRNCINKRIDKSRLLAPKDPKDLKKIKNRIASIISVKASQVLKQRNFLKFKTSLKITVEAKIKEIRQNNYNERVQGRDKLNHYCLQLLDQKYKKKVQMKLIQAYSKDLLLTANKLFVCTQTCSLIEKLNNYVISIPFLSKLFVTPNQNFNIDSKILYDQAKTRVFIGLQKDMINGGQIKKPYYIYTRDQYLEEWNNDNHNALKDNITLLDTRQFLKDIKPPTKKQQLFKWGFSIPDLAIQVHEKDAYQHMVHIFHPYTGKLTQSSYRSSKMILPEPPRDKYLTLMNYYKSIIEYIEANILIISLQIQEQILLSLQNIIKKKINFQQRYFIQDQNSIRQTINSLQNQDLSIIFKYIVDLSSIKKDVEKKIIEKNYMDKKQHWVVHDEVTDFIMSKVQGYGVLRQSYLPLFQDLKHIKDIKSDQSSFLKTKTDNIYKLIYLSSSQMYINEIFQMQQSDYYAYHNKINQWLCNCHKLQDYGTSTDSNNRINIMKEICYDQDQKERFNNGLYSHASKQLANRLKYLAYVPSIDLEKYLDKIIYKTNSQASYNYLHNAQFLLQGINLFKKMGQKNRLKLFTRIRYHFQLGDQYLSTKSSNINMLQKEVHKSNYYDLIQNKKILSLSCIAFTGQVKFPRNSIQFKDHYMQLKDTVDLYTHYLYQNLQQFKEQNKIQFSKWQINFIGKNEGTNSQEYNRIIRQVLSCKLLKEQVRARIVGESVKILKAERLPKQQMKKIVNASLIPRVHLISSYSSPLITERKTYISQQYKLSFLQAFINRFRNKVSRVDLLSSGYGFVITVSDLQDCVNYMNKLLFTFTQKEFKHRIQSFSQYYQILIEAINQKNKTINQQSALIKFLQAKNNNLLEAQYLNKVTKLLHQKTLVEDKLLVVQNNINGLEDRVRKVVQIQYDKKIKKLQKQNQELKEIFNKVKHLHMINTKEAAKNDFLDIINYYKDKISDLLNKKVDFTITFDNNSSHQQSNKRVKEEQSKDKYRQEDQRQQSNKYVTEDLQKCKIGQDILFDPYYTTKLINKMRLFNIFKLGSKKLKHQEQDFRKNEQMTELQKIQDSVVAQSERQILIRDQFNRIQEQLSKKCLQLEKLKYSLQSMDNEKIKLKILMQSKEKKIQQKDREIQQLKKKIESKDSIINESEKQKATSEQQQSNKINMLRKEKKYKKIQKTPFVTNIDKQSNSNNNTLTIYDRFELSNKDGVWRQKCQQLYIQNKKLISQLQRYQSQSNTINSNMPVPTPKRQSYSLNMRNRRQSASDAPFVKQIGKFPNISYKYSILKQ